MTDPSCPSRAPSRRLLPLDSLADHVGHTPLVRLHRCLPDLPGVEIWAKLEGFNPGGSVSDRAATRPPGRCPIGESIAQTCGRLTHFVIGPGTPAPAFASLDSLKSSVHLVAVGPQALGCEEATVDPGAGASWAVRLAREEGLLCGAASGAALAGAVVLALGFVARAERAVIVALLPDGPDRSVEAFAPPTRPPPAW